MPYLLRLATNGYAQLASTFSVAGTSSLSIKFKAAFTSGVTSEVYGLGTGTGERLQYNGTGFFFRLNGTNGNTITTTTIASLVSGYSVSNANEYELRKILFEDGTRTRYRLFVNGTDCGILMSIFGSGGDTFQFSRIGSASTTFMNGDLYYMDCFVDGVKTRSYDPSITGGSGSTLVDTTGSQNGTLNGTYSWVFYSAGSDTALQATATGVSTATAALTTAVRLAAAAVGVSTATASLTTGIPLQAFGAGVSTATAQLSTQVRLNAAALGVSSATASLTTSIRLAASALGQSSATANLTTGGSGLSANAVGQSTATANLTTAIRLTANAVAQATATATLAGTSAQLAAAAVGVSTATAALSTSIRLQASAVALASSTAQLTTQIRLSAAGYSVSVATAELTIGQVLPPEIDAYKMKMTRITSNYKLQQQVSFSIINATPKFKIGRA